MILAKPVYRKREPRTVPADGVTTLRSVACADLQTTAETLSILASLVVIGQAALEKKS
jgi:hypothetical protein